VLAKNLAKRHLLMCIGYLN